MKLYGWRKPVIKADHTWVTDYDSRTTPYKTPSDIENAKKNYWYCHGNFYVNGIPPKPIIANAEASSAAHCLVNANVRGIGGYGTIFVYGVDGVCHQVSNQVLYATASGNGGRPKTVSSAAGWYKLSTALYGTYGRRERLWRKARIHCGVAPETVKLDTATTSLLSKRVSSTLSCNLTKHLLE